MRRLGEILLERGAIAVSELHTGLESCRRTGGRLGTQLLRYGFVDEETLLQALSEQFGTPHVLSRLIERSPVEVRRMIPLEILQRVQAVPFERTSSRLRVAMTNPRDPAAVDELQQHAGMPLDIHVGIETAIAAALQELEENGSAVTLADKDSARAAGGAAAAGEWEALWAPPRLAPEDLLRLRPASRPESKTVRVSTFPGLSRVVEGQAADAEEVVDEASFVDRLKEARHRNDVGDVLLRFIVGLLHRSALFTIHKGQVVGWMARGQSVVIDDVQTFVADATAPSVFSDVIEVGQPFSGPLGPGPVNKHLAEVLGEPAPVQVVAAPIQVKGRTIACLVGDIPGEAVLAVPLHEVLAATRRAGLALEMLIMRNKITA